MVVLDSNIYVSALVFGGNPRAILELAEVEGFEVAVSDPIKADVGTRARTKALAAQGTDQRRDCLPMDIGARDQPATDRE